jgi:chromate transporter
MLDSRLLGLIIVFAPLSLLSFGGGQAIVADIQHQTVGVWGWLSDQEFTDLFALSRAAPGPSTLIAALIGWHLDGLIGAIVATLAIYVPSSILLYGAASWWLSRPHSRVRGAIERGLGPVAVGLIFAGALAVIQAAHMSTFNVLTTVVATTLLYLTDVSPYALIGAVALIYAGAYSSGAPFV